MEKLEFCRQQLSAGTGSGSFFSQLKQRHVVRVAIAYCVTAWLLAQIATQISPFFEIPNLECAPGHSGAGHRLPHRAGVGVGF